MVSGVGVPRRRAGLADARKAWAFAEEKKKGGDAFWSSLLDPRQVTTLPYPGFYTDPGRRPGYIVNFVGTQNLQKVFDAWDVACRDEGGHTKNLFVMGAKGIGKSCLMRAFAWNVYVYEPEALKLICIWNMESARRNFFVHVQAALEFTYFKNPDVSQEIAAMQNMSEVEVFLRSREDKGAVFVFLIDGAQAVDTVRWHKKPRRDDDGLLKATRSALKELVKDRHAIWVLSPKAEQTEEFAERDMADIVMVRIDTGFDKVTMDGYLSHAILGLLVKERQQRDIAYYAGTYPLLLQTLEECCRTVAAKMMGIESNDVRREDAAIYLEDDEAWTKVLYAFLDHRQVTTMESDINRYLTLEEGSTYDTVEKMIHCDARYALNTNEYCSPYVKQLYVEAFRQKENAASVYDCSSWVVYCDMLLSQNCMNWAELGWLCERLCADVISRGGIDIGDRFTIGNLSVQRFKEVPTLSCAMVPGHGFLFLPLIFNFACVDAIIAFRGVDGKLHLIGIQFTTSVEQHMHSEIEFMSYQALKEWDVLGKDWNLHYAFICLTKIDKSVEKKDNLRPLRGGKVVGTVAHFLHIISFETALGKRVGEKTLKLLRKMTELREAQYKLTATTAPPPANDGAPSLEVLNKLKRKELNVMAVDMQIDPNGYRTKGELIAALLSK